MKLLPPGILGLRAAHMLTVCLCFCLQQEYDSSIPNWEFARMIKEFRVTMECHPLTVTDPVSIPESLPPLYLSRTGRTLKDKEKACCDPHSLLSAVWRVLCFFFPLPFLLCMCVQFHLLPPPRLCLCVCFWGLNPVLPYI